MKTLLSAFFLFFTAFSAFCDPMVADPDALTSFREQRDEAFASLEMAETAGVGLLMVIMVGFAALAFFAGSSQKSKRMAVILIASLVPALSYAQNVNINRQVNRQRSINNNSNVNSNSNVNRNVNHNNSNANVVDNSVYEAPFDLLGYTAWKKYQQERTQYSRTKKGAPLSPLDSQAPHTMPATAPAGDAKAKYDRFLRAKGINPNSIGGAAVVAGKMIVPTIEETYANRNSNIYQALVDAKVTVEGEEVAKK